jgi:hypothetical protein
MEEAAPLWQSILALVGFVVLVVGPVMAVVWARRRRARGEEASADTTQGAPANINVHGQM